jgi:cysteine desulfurase / selenocysteine lyase
MLDPQKLAAIAAEMSGGDPLGPPGALAGGIEAARNVRRGMGIDNCPLDGIAPDAMEATIRGALGELMQMMPSAAMPAVASSGAAAPLAAPEFYFLRDLAPAATPQTPTPLPDPDGFDVHAVRADFPILGERINGKPLAWLDNAATTQKPRAVIDRIVQFYEHENSNVHRGAHALATRSTEAYERARGLVASFIGAPSQEEIVFVRGTTEAVNLVAATYGRQVVGAGDEIVVAQYEHHANIVPWQMLAQERGAHLRVIPFDERGVLDLAAYERLLGPRTKLVALAHVSNVLGTVTPLAEMIATAHQHGARVFVDGAQGIPHTRVNVTALDADFYAFSGHKLFAPTGIGALFAKRELLEQMTPYQTGGNMIRTVTFEQSTFAEPPQRFEAGTGSLAPAVGLGAAIEYLERIGFDRAARYEHRLLEYAMPRLAEIPGLRLIGTAPEKVSVLAFVVAGTAPEHIASALDAQGIAVRVGHHCAQPTLRRYGLTQAVRPSLAFYNTYEEIDRLIATIRAAIA